MLDAPFGETGAPFEVHARHKTIRGVRTAFENEAHQFRLRLSGEGIREVGRESTESFLVSIRQNGQRMAEVVVVR